MLRTPSCWRIGCGPNSVPSAAERMSDFECEGRTHWRGTDDSQWLPCNRARRAGTIGCPLPLTTGRCTRRSYAKVAGRPRRVGARWQDGAVPVPDEPRPAVAQCGTSVISCALATACNARSETCSRRGRKWRAALLGSALRELQQDRSPLKLHSPLLGLELGRCYIQRKLSLVLEGWHHRSETVAGTFALQAISHGVGLPGDVVFRWLDAGGILTDAPSEYGRKSIERLAPVMDHPGPSANRGRRRASSPRRFSVLSGSQILPTTMLFRTRTLADFFYVWHKRTLPDLPLSARPL